jgi:GntR family transcriptional regulator
MVLIKVDTNAFVPLYEQVKTEIRRLAAVGAVRANDPLPSIRELAAEVLVNPNTVARAYRELEKEGLIYTQKGRGSFLSVRRERGLDRDTAAYLGRRMDATVREAATFGLGAAEIRKLIDDSLRRLKGAGATGGGNE